MLLILSAKQAFDLPSPISQVPGRWLARHHIGSSSHLLVA
jgi:hypothetical protein